jgi:hypothetical protein
VVCLLAWVLLLLSGSCLSSRAGGDGVWQLQQLHCLAC